MRGSDLAPAYPCGGRKARKVAVLGFPRNFLFRLPRPFPLPIPPVLALGLPPPPPATVVAADAGVLLTAEPAGAREVRKTAAGPLGLPLRARPSVPPPLSALVSLGGSPGRPSFRVACARVFASGFRMPGPRGVRLISQPVRGCARSGRGGPGVGDPCPAAPGPARRLLRGRPRLSPKSRAAGVTSLPAPGLGLARPLARVRPVSPGLPPPLRVQLLSRLEPCGPPVLH